MIVDTYRRIARVGVHDDECLPGLCTISLTRPRSDIGGGRSALAGPLVIQAGKSAWFRHGRPEPNTRGKRLILDG